MALKQDDLPKALHVLKQLLTQLAAGVSFELGDGRPPESTCFEPLHLAGDAPISRAGEAERQPGPRTMPRFAACDAKHPMPQPPPLAAIKPPTPERWQVSASDAATATLTIPADARRERRFEIACAVTVGVPQAAHHAWHQMTVQANGVQQWRRKEPSHNPGAWDGLDYRFSRSVPVGQVLRVTVAVAVHGARRRTLVIEADEI